MIEIKLTHGDWVLVRTERKALWWELDSLLKAIAGKKADKFAGHQHEEDLRVAMYMAWQHQLREATNVISKMMAQNYLYPPAASEATAIMGVLNAHLGSSAIANAVRVTARPAMIATVQLGKASVDAQYKKQTGKAPSVGAIAKADISFGIIFGMTEDHAVQALTDQITLAAGGFWDQEMTDSVRKEVESYFDGSLTREDLSKKLNELVNDRLSIESAATGEVAKTLPSSYFDGLAEHYVVRARSVGSVYRGKALGAQEYQTVAVMDKRTCPICKSLEGKTFAMAGAQAKVEGILSARKPDELKAVAPFLTERTAGDATAPLAPHHWRCRCWEKMIFEGGF